MSAYMYTCMYAIPHISSQNKSPTLLECIGLFVSREAWKFACEHISHINGLCFVYPGIACANLGTSNARMDKAKCLFVSVRVCSFVFARAYKCVCV